eukprot:jgi/Tetstr1/426409/TSEL_016720.t1
MGRRASKLQDKLRKEMGQFRPGSGTAVLPKGRVLVKRVEQIVPAWSAGDARKSKDGLNCSMWQAMLPQLCTEDALQKGEAAGYKQWSELPRERGVCLALKEYYSAKERYITSKKSASSGTGSRSFNMSASSLSITSRISTFTVSLAPLSVPLLVYALRISYLKGCLYLAATASALVLLLTLVCERRIHSMRLYQQRWTTCPPTLETPPSQAKCMAILRSGISEVQAGLYGEPAKGEFSAERMWMEEIALEVNRLACTVGLEPQDPQAGAASQPSLLLQKLAEIRELLGLS